MLAFLTDIFPHSSSERCSHYGHGWFSIGLQMLPDTDTTLQLGVWDQSLCKTMWEINFSLRRDQDTSLYPLIQHYETDSVCEWAQGSWQEMPGETGFTDGCHFFSLAVCFCLMLPHKMKNLFLFKWEIKALSHRCVFQFTALYTAQFVAVNYKDTCNALYSAVSSDW